MILYFSVKDKLGTLKQYSWWFSTMEFSLDVLSSVCASGKKVVSAELIDRGCCTPLPIEAFDGRGMSAPLYELEEQWKYLLFSPVVS